MNSGYSDERKSLSVIAIQDALMKLSKYYQEQFLILLSLFSDVQENRITIEDFEQRLVAIDKLELLKLTAGQNIRTSSGIISFGKENQFGDITFRDVAGRDIFNISLNIYNTELKAIANSNLKHPLEGRAKSKLDSPTKETGLPAETLAVTLLFASCDLEPARELTAVLENLGIRVYTIGTTSNLLVSIVIIYP